MNKGSIVNRCISKYKRLTIMIWESNILLKFLFGKCTRQETDEVNAWLNESKHNQRTLSHLKSTVNIYLQINSFDFTIETVGQFDNMSLVFKASHVMLDKVAAFKKVIQENEGLITQSDTTLPNGFDIKLIGEDYTLGKALEYVLYSRHYDRQSATSDKSLDFCGFRKPHPHIDESLIRLGFKDATDKSTVVAILVEACKALEVTFNSISDYFKKVD